MSTLISMAYIRHKDHNKNIILRFYYFYIDDWQGKANMVDVGHKIPSRRVAKAQGSIILGKF